MFLREMDELAKGNQIYLKIYHISIANYFLQPFGYGLYHTTIEIKGKEYFFCYAEEEYIGIMSFNTEDMKMPYLKGISKFITKRNFTWETQSTQKLKLSILSTIFQVNGRGKLTMSSRKIAMTFQENSQNPSYTQK